MHNAIDRADVLKYLEKVFPSAGIGVDIMDAKYNIRYIDPCWKKRYGDPAGRKCYQYFMGRKKVCPNCGVAKALRTKKIIVTEEILSAENNRPIIVTTVPFRTKEGEWLVAETNVDIADMKQAQEDLKDSIHWYRSLFEESNDAIFIADAASHMLVDCNKKALAMMGYSRRKLMSMRVEQLHPKESVAFAMKSFKGMVIGKAISTETEIVTKSGKIIPVIITGTLIIAHGKKRLMGVFRDISMRRESEKALALTNSFLSATIESLFTGILVRDLAGKAMLYNKKFIEMWHFPKSIIAAKDDNALLRFAKDQLKDPKLFLKKVKEAYRNPGKERFDILEFKDGRVFERYFRPQILDGKIIGMLWAFHDITMSKINQDKLCASEEKLNKMFVNASVGAVVVSLKGNILLPNKAFCDILGYSSDELSHMTILDITYPQERKYTRQLMKNLLNNNCESFRVEKRYVRKDGVVRWVEVSVSLLHDSHGNPESFLGQVTDITARKQVDEELRLSEERYRVLSESANDAIYMIDKDGRIAYVNTYAAEYFTVNPADMLGKPLSDFFAPETVHMQLREIKQVFRTGVSMHAIREFDFRGQKVWLDTRLCPIITADGMIKYVMGTSRDITLLKRSEAILKRDKMELKELVDKKSSELLASQDKLNRAQRLSDIGAFAATVAHELRSPLAAIRLAAYNIMKKSGMSPIKGNIDNIERKVMESEHIIQDLLLYASIKVPTREPVNACDVSDECLKLTREIFYDYEVEVERDYKCSADTIVQADPIQMKEVFNNVLCNAYESFKKKKGRIKIEIALYQRDYLRILITDNGQGIPPEKMRHIFEPFLSTKAKGTGLGLPVCNQIMNLHNGKIKISSQLNEGTIVSLLFPIRDTIPGGK